MHSRRPFATRLSLRVQAVAIIVLAGLAGILVPDTTGARVLAQGYAPVWESTPCQHARAPGSTTYCGYLIVPERREAPTGRQVKVYHTIMPALDGSTANIPVMYLTGGPGATTWQAVDLFEISTGDYGIYRQKFGRTRDLVIVDQRGTNRSIPALYCAEELGKYRPLVYQSDFELAANVRVQGLLACRDRWLRQGVDLSGYDDYEVAADVADFLKARGIPRINLYGASWGTRLSMQVMKLYPQLLNAVVIDSILPPELNPFIAEVQGTQHGIQALIDHSRNDYPQLDAYINTILRRLRSAPVNVTGRQGAGACSGPGTGASYTVHVTADKFIDYLASQLRSTPYCSNLPKNITHMFDTQQYQFIADNWIGSMDFSFPAGGPESGAPADAMFQSVFAANDAFFATPADVLDNILRRVTEPAMAEWLANSFIYREAAMLRAWPVDPMPASVRDPVVSSVPTMMLVGALDVATPSIFSRPSEAGLSNHVYHEIAAGHAVAYLPCVLDMLDAWFQRPGVAPVNRCQQGYGWDAPSNPLTVVDAPVSGSDPTTSFSVSGWAVDRGAVNGSGVDAVQVFAFPRIGDGVGEAIFLGSATVGQPRPDVGAALGTQYTNSGYSFTVSGLPAGSYRIGVYARSTVMGTFVAPKFSDIEIGRSQTP